jgi:hypothetical protein
MVLSLVLKGNKLDQVLSEDAKRSYLGVRDSNFALITPDFVTCIS